MNCNDSDTKYITLSILVIQQLIKLQDSLVKSLVNHGRKRPLNRNFRHCLGSSVRRGPERSCHRCHPSLHRWE